MAIVMISGLYQSGQEELAQILVKKTKWPVIGREDLLDKARELGVKIGRLETAMVKGAIIKERLAREKELYLALITATLCDKASEGDFIYHGRMGHLLLPGVSERLRICVASPMEDRIDRTTKSLNLTPEKAKSYLEQLDEDMMKWSRFIHQVEGYAPGHFDATFNLETINLRNVCEIIVSMAALPDFSSNASEGRQLENLRLASKAKLRFALDERTGGMDLQVQANNGVLTVTYPPHQEKSSQYIPEVLDNLEGCREIQCTMAETNILWVQERFEPDSANFHEVTQLAQRWGAAVELMRLVAPEREHEVSISSGGNVIHPYTKKSCKFAYTGGVEDDDPEEADDGGLTLTQEELIRIGKSGGSQIVCGYSRILDNVKSSGKYALVVIGNMFLSKGHSAQIRLTREFVMNIRDRIKAPVITTDELKSEFFFGAKQGLKLLGCLALVILIYAAVFTHQEELIAFLSGPMHEKMKWLSPIVVFLFIPIIASLYGSIAGMILKVINID